VLQASRMWRLFPVQPQGRLAPAKVRIEDATADLAQLEQWACEHPGRNWGLATGMASGVFFLEVDTRRASRALRILSRGEWDGQQTLQSQAGDTGYAFFRWPAARAMRGSGKNPAPGLRIRGEGDFVLIPPSVCPSGISHVYLDPDAEIAAAPQWLLDSVFAGLEERSSGKLLAFPNFPLHLNHGSSAGIVLCQTSPIRRPGLLSVRPACSAPCLHVTSASRQPLVVPVYGV
jgi:hypothetical protein